MEDNNLSIPLNINVVYSFLFSYYKQIQPKIKSQNIILIETHTHLYTSIANNFQQNQILQTHSQTQSLALSLSTAIANRFKQNQIMILIENTHTHKQSLLSI